MPSLVPDREPFDHNIHIVLEDYGRLGRAYRETGEADADRKTLIDDILTGQYDEIARIVAFNTEEGWARDVTQEVAREVAERARRDGLELKHGALALVRRQLKDFHL